MKAAIAYWTKAVSADAAALRGAFRRNGGGMQETILTAFLGAIAAVFQAAGGFLPGIGLLISPLAAAPIQLGIVYSVRCGVMSYAVAIALLAIIQPGELIVFPFTTGLLGIATGFGLMRLNNRAGTVLAGASGLWAGIAVLLYALRFPVLGPAVPVAFEARQLGIVAVFCLAYSWLWLELSLFVFRKIRAVLEVR